MGWLLVKMLLGLGVTVGAIYLSLSYVARRLQGFPGARSAVVKVVERVPLEPRRTLWVVEVAGEYLLLSSGDGPMTLLAKLDADKAREAVAQARSSTTAPKPFWLKLLEKRQAPGGK
jgi:flagellar protein FliO/FliZ